MRVLFHWAVIVSGTRCLTPEDEFARRVLMEFGTYLSPVRKLAQFFERSRNGWKGKCLDAKVRIKRLGNQKQKLRASRDRWKLLAHAAQRELRETQSELEELNMGE